MAEKRLPRERLFAATYNEINQAARLGDSDRPDDFWLNDLRGRMRLDALTFRRIVLPIQYITDGACLLEAGPSRILDSVSRAEGSTPFQFFGTKQTFDESLIGLFRRGEYVHGVVFDSIRDAELRLRLATQLAKTPAINLDNALRHADSIPKGIGVFLTKVLREADSSPDSDIERLLLGWDNWSKALRRFPISRWPGSPRFLDGLSYCYPGPDQLGNAGRAAYDAVLELGRSAELRRADVRMVFARSRDQIGNPEDVAEVNHLETEVERAWERSVALACDCSYGYEVEPSEGSSSRLDQLLAQAGTADGELPREILQQLGSLDTADFHRFASNNREQLEQWWKTGDRNAYHGAMSKLTKALAKESTSTSDEEKGLVDMLVSIPIPALIAGTAWAASDLGAQRPIGLAVSGTAGAIGSVVSLLATKSFRDRTRQRRVARLVEYGITAT